MRDKEYQEGYTVGLATPSTGFCPYDGRTKAGKEWWRGFMVGDAERCAALAEPAPKMASVSVDPAKIGHRIADIGPGGTEHNVETVGPWPPEPPAGSAEAVAQAAETLRGRWQCEGCGAWVDRDPLTPQGRGHQVPNPDGSPGYCGPVSLRSVESLPPVPPLNQHYFPSAINGSTVRVFLDDRTCEPHFDDGHEIKLSRVQGAEILKLAEQRGKLADALEALRKIASGLVNIIDESAGGLKLRDQHIYDAVEIQVIAALRKAGRS